MAKEVLEQSFGSVMVRRGRGRESVVFVVVSMLTGCADDRAGGASVASVHQELTQTHCLSTNADTGIDEDNPTTNTGSAVTCFVNGDRPDVGDRSCLFRWNVAPIPSNATVLSATMYVSVAALSNAQTGEDYDVHELKRLWVEGAATWNNASVSTAWQVPGALGSNDRGSVVGVLVGDNLTGRHQVPLNAALVQAWVNQSAPNHGVIVARSTSQDTVRLETRHASQTANRPQLEVEVSMPSGTGGTGGSGPGNGGGGGFGAIGDCN